MVVVLAPKTKPVVAGVSLFGGAPNENVAVVAGLSSSLLAVVVSIGFAPNWKVAAEATDSLGLKAKPALSLGAPKLKLPLGACELALLPKLKPFVFGSVAAASALSMPNLKLPAFAGMSTLNCKLDLGFSVPGFAVSQAMHLSASDLLESMQLSHAHEPSGFLNISPKPEPLLILVVVVEAAVADVADLAPGLGVSQATHLLLSDLLDTMQVSQVHEPSGFLNISPKPDAAGAAGLAPGFGVSQAGHLVASDLFCSIQPSHVHEPSAFLNLSPKPDVVVAFATFSFVRLGLLLIKSGLAVLQHGQVFALSAFLTMQQGHSQVLFFAVLKASDNGAGLFVTTDFKRVSLGVESALLDLLKMLELGF